MPKTRPDPNIRDPLAEPTIGRRIWAAYLAAGYNRATWAEATEITYKTADNYDTGATLPSLEHCLLAAKLTGFSMDDLCYGHRRPHGQRSELELSRDGVKALLHELRASVEAIEALGEHERSAAGTYQRFTRSYVAAFVERFGLARREGLSVQEAIVQAKTTAANARANAEAIAARLKPTSAQALAELGEHIKTPEKTSTGNMVRRKRA